MSSLGALVPLRLRSTETLVQGLRDQAQQEVASQRYLHEDALGELCAAHSSRPPHTQLDFDGLQRVKKVDMHQRQMRFWVLLSQMLEFLANPQYAAVITTPRSGQLEDQQDSLRQAVAAVDLAATTATHVPELQELSRRLRVRFREDAVKLAALDLDVTASRRVRQETDMWDLAEILATHLPPLDHRLTSDVGHWVACIRSIAEPRNEVGNVGSNVVVRTEHVMLLTRQQGARWQRSLTQRATAQDNNSIAQVNSAVARVQRFLQTPQAAQGAYAVVTIVLGGGVIAVGVITVQVLVIVGGSILAAQGIARIVKILGERWLTEHALEILNLCSAAVNALNSSSGSPALQQT